MTATLPGIAERLGKHQVKNIHEPTARTLFIETRHGIGKALSVDETARLDSAEFAVAVGRAAHVAITGSASLCTSRSRVPIASRPGRRFDEMQHGACLCGRRPVERMPRSRSRAKREPLGRMGGIT